MRFSKQKLFTGVIIAFLFCSNIFLWEKLQANEIAKTEVIFNHEQKADEKLIETIQNAQKYVYFAIYTITKENIADALIAAKLKGLDVKGVLDANQSTIEQEKPIIRKLEKYGIELKMPKKEQGLMHMKMLVTDNSYASGSFNWTYSATVLNDEVLEIGQTESIRNQYLRVFNELFAYKPS